MRETPPEMKAELAKWNNDAGIDLETWVQATGNLELAVGYSTIFWPEFQLLNDYIVRASVKEENLAEWERTCGNKKALEAVLNHLHVADIHYNSPDLTKEKIIYLLRVLEEIYKAKLAWQFPDRPCEVQIFIPEDPNNLTDYQITFFQKKHATKN